jgi:hypothetical protein
MTHNGRREAKNLENSLKNILKPIRSKFRHLGDYGVYAYPCAGLASRSRSLIVPGDGSWLGSACVDICPNIGQTIMFDATYKDGKWTLKLYGSSYDLKDDADKILKCIKSKIDEREQRIEAKKRIDARRERFGNFDGDSYDSIQSATFEVYLDANQAINVANPVLTGKVKYFRKASIPCEFDIDQRKIYAYDIQKNKRGRELVAKNSGLVIDELIKCLADRKK